MHAAKKLVLFIFLLLTIACVGQKNDFNIVTSDVTNFWEAVDQLKYRNDTTQVFQTLVIDRASDEFKVFIRKWNIKASDYAYQIKRYPGFYKTLREHSIKLINDQDSVRKIVARFRQLYSNFNKADICVSFGNFSTGGNIAMEKGRNLVYIGLEYHGLDSATDMHELHTSTRDYVSRSNFFRTIIHELVHIQQRTHGMKIQRTFDGNYLANRILSEGLSDFIAQLIVVNGNNGNYHQYGLQNEMDLKRKLKNELWSTKSGSWFGGDDAIFINFPRDLGYFMGSRIGRNFYIVNRLQDGNLTELIEIKNLKKFIDKSQYFDGI